MVAMSKNSMISNKGQVIIIKKDSLKIKLDDKIKMQNGFMCRIVLQVNPTEDVSFAAIGN